MKDKKTLIIAGLISGGVFTLSWTIFHILFVKDGVSNDEGMGETIGYLTMLIAFTTVYFGISFKEAFLNGMIVVLVASTMYVLVWMIYYPNFMPDFADQYAANQIQSLNESGLEYNELEVKIKEVEDFTKNYKNPIVMAGFTFLEVFPVGLIVALIVAFILKRNN